MNKIKKEKTKSDWEMLGKVINLGHHNQPSLCEAA